MADEADLNDPRRGSTMGGTAPPAIGDGAIYAAPLTRRGLAFALDLVILAACLAVSWLFLADLDLLFVLIGFVGYHTALPWLTGSTPGKALLGLRLERLDGKPYQADVVRLPWLLGRSAIGYLLVDVFGLGIAAALLYRQRRPLHDVVFRTAVVTTRAETRRSLRERLEEFDRRLQDKAGEVSWPRRPLTRVGKWIVTALLALSAGRAMIRRWLLRGSRSAAPQPTSPTTAATAPSTAATLGILAVTTIISTAIWLQVPESTWFGDDDPDEVVVAGGPTRLSTTSSEPAVDPGVDLASLRSAPVPAMCDNPAGTMTDGTFQPATGGETALVESSLFASAGWSTTGVGDLTGDGVDEGVAVLVCLFPDGGNAFETLAVVYRTGPTILAAMQFDGVTTARIDDGAVDLVGLTVDGQDARCCPSVVTARSFRLDGDQLVDAGRDVVTTEDAVTPGAWGDLPIPSSYADTALALGEPIDVSDGVEGNAVSFSPDTYQCHDTSQVGGSDSYFLGVSDQTAILYVYDSALRTSEGVGIGSTAEKVRAAYGAELFEAANEYSEIPDLYVGDPALTEGTPGIRFVLDQTTMNVTLMMVGEFTSIMAPEGCI